MKLEGLIQELKKNNPNIDVASVAKAYAFAVEAHEMQKRESGEDYVNHPLRVAFTLAKMKLDTATIVAGMLHDVIEDTEKSKDEIRKLFGGEVLKLVEGATKLDKIKYQGQERYAESLKKMILAVGDDIRVAFIKLADRLDNLKSLRFLTPEKQKEKARETMEIYAPIANRLGIGWLKGELEDLAFPYLHTQEYNWLLSQVKDKYIERERFLKKLEPKILRLLKKEGINVIQMDQRAKHYWSLYQKLQFYDKDITKIYDLVAFRIIVPNVEQCYGALGAIHKNWAPLPGRVKDYIALPKPNGYKSLHTTVICDNGVITEFQIRTPEMHAQAEYGISSHWYYSEQKGIKKVFKKVAVKAPEKSLALVKQLNKWQQDIKKSGPAELLQNIRIDFFKTRIYVFTPRGDVIELPEKSCAIDFAYAIHTDVGNHCSMVKINGEAKSLYHQLKNGDIVEILTDKNRRPSHDWLNFVHTHVARSHIKKELAKLEAPKPQAPLVALLERAKKLFPKKSAKEKPGTILVAGQANISAKISKCCQPKTSDEIIGYIGTNQAVSIHKLNCKNFAKLKQKNPGKVIEAHWQK